MPGMVPLFSHIPVIPLEYVAFGADVNAVAAAQSNVVGSVGKANVAAGAGGNCFHIGAQCNI